MRYEGEEFAEDVIDVAGGLEFTGKRSEAASGLIGSQKLVFATGVEDAKFGVFMGAGHTASAPVGKGELT